MLCLQGHILLMDGYYNADASLAAGVDALLRGLMSKEQGEVEVSAAANDTSIAALAWLWHMIS